MTILNEIAQAAQSYEEKIISAVFVDEEFVEVTFNNGTEMLIKADGR